MYHIAHASSTKCLMCIPFKQQFIHLYRENSCQESVVSVHAVYSYRIIVETRDIYW